MREPIGFLSYVRNDDAHDNGQITRIRERLEGELRLQTGVSFPIFQDRNDISWGQRWFERIESSLKEATFLFPIITPSFFTSKFCRMELETFILKEKEIGLDRLIMPIYYVTVDALGRGIDDTPEPDELIKVIASRNYFDLRAYRFSLIGDPKLNLSISDMAQAVKIASREVQIEISAKEFEIKREPKSPSSVEKKSPRKLKKAMPEEKEAAAHETLRENFTYAIYTDEFDEVITPNELMSDSERLSLFSILSRGAAGLEKSMKTDFRSLIHSGVGRNLAVSILMDHSGSLRGDPIVSLANAILLLGDELDRAGVRFELLGHTTRAWKGGASREKWLNGARPKNPGRLNDLRYIVYKSFQDIWREKSPGLGLMLKEGLLKENIDGEALLWAHSRLVNQSSKKKLLLVLSDGAPVDDSTLSVNPVWYLEEHLLRTIRDIRENSDVELGSIGIRYDVSRYYGGESPVAISADDILSSAMKLITQLRAR